MKKQKKEEEDEDEEEKKKKEKRKKKEEEEKQTIDLRPTLPVTVLKQAPEKQQQKAHTSKAGAHLHH